MHRLLFALALHACTPAAEAEPAAVAAIEVGRPAPDFTLADTEGNTVKLADLRGKTVVLEWFNPDCPFVVHAHGAEGPLASLPAKWTEKGVVWLAINSGAPGLQGHGVERNREARAGYGMGYPVLLDEKGDVGRAYGAKNTPGMYVIDAQGTLVYQGGLDNAPFGKPKSGDTVVPYVDRALEALAAGQPVSPASTPPYGCSVKYGG